MKWTFVRGNHHLETITEGCLVNRFLFQLICGLFLAAVASSPLSAQESFTVTDTGFGGVSGSSDGGEFSVKGTTKDVGKDTSSGGEFSVKTVSLQGIVVLQVEDAPMLIISRSGQTAIIAWMAPAGAYKLQETASLAAAGTGWMDSPIQVTTNGNLNMASVPATTGVRFFRLHQTSP